MCNGIHGITTWSMTNSIEFSRKCGSNRGLPWFTSDFIASGRKRKWRPAAIWDLIADAAGDTDRQRNGMNS